MISLETVSKWYNGQSKVLNSVSFELQKGDFLYVVGGSGTGKTSLLRMIATEEAPSVGTIKLFGYELSKVTASTLRSMRRAIGYVPQRIQLIPDFTVYENVALALVMVQSKEKADKQKRISEVLEGLDLARLKSKKTAELSGGEAQRVAVAQALVRSPEILIADEPTGAQDREHTWAMMDQFVKTHMKGCTVLVATHDREIVKRVRKKCAVLKGGGISMTEGSCLY